MLAENGYLTFKVPMAESLRMSTKICEISALKFMKNYAPELSIPDPVTLETKQRCKKTKVDFFWMPI